jgi:hypothetical protein
MLASASAAVWPWPQILIDAAIHDAAANPFGQTERIAIQN